MVRIKGVEHLLADDQLDDALAWVREAQVIDAHDHEAAELLVRVLASEGDRAGAWAPSRRPTPTTPRSIARGCGSS